MTAMAKREAIISAVAKVATWVESHAAVVAVVKVATLIVTREEANAAHEKVVAVPKLETWEVTCFGDMQWWQLRN